MLEFILSTSGVELRVRLPRFNFPAGVEGITIQAVEEAGREAFRCELQQELVEIRRLLLSHAKVNPDPARVRFVGFGAFSLDVEITSYVSTADWAEFLAVREDLLLRLMDIVASSGSGFAFPSHTTYVARDDGLDGEKARSAEEQVRAWRERGELPLPDFAEESKNAFDDTVRYPPEGSAASIGKRASGEVGEDDR